jgi:hypothetical protein
MEKLVALTGSGEKASESFSKSSSKTESSMISESMAAMCAMALHTGA